MIKVVIFDFDGVLVDSNEAWADIYSRASKAAGIKESVNSEDIIKHFGRPYSEVFRGSHPRHAGDADLMGVVYENLFEMASSDDFIRSFKSIRGIRDSLAELKKTHKLAVCSGNSRGLLENFLEL